MYDFKLVAIDLDGSLLDDVKQISDLNIDVLLELEKRGIEIIIATGRRYFAAKKFVEKYMDDLMILSNNGNIIRRTKDDFLYFSDIIDHCDFKYVLENGRNLGLHPLIHVSEFDKEIDVIFDNKTESYSYIESMKDKRYKKINTFDNYCEDNILSICYFAKKDKLLEFQELVDKNRFKCIIFENMNMPDFDSDNFGFLEIIKAKSSKWRSIELYATRKGIESSEIVAIGDDLNDIEMIVNAGIGIAMNNAADSVKKIADVVTDYDNNQSGVAYILAKIFNL